MTVSELREALMFLDQDSEVLLTDGVHFTRRRPIDRIEEDYANPHFAGVVLIGQSSPNTPHLPGAHGY